MHVPKKAYDHVLDGGADEKVRLAGGLPERPQADRVQLGGAERHVASLMTDGGRGGPCRWVVSQLRPAVKREREEGKG
jgi:hypothetical protein